jgi:VWFA-related protein
MRVLIAALCLALNGGADWAQDGGVIRVETREVLVPVIVTDAKGHHVTGLKASDFHVQEDGVEQKIRSFSSDTAPDARALAALGGGTAPVNDTPATLPHTFVICLDTLHSSFANMRGVSDALARLFEKEKNGTALYSIVAVGRQLQVLVNATTDPAIILARLRSAAFQSRLGGGDAAGFTSELNDLKNSMFDMCRRCAACGSRNYHACDSELAALKTRLDGQAERWSGLTGQMLAQWKAVLEELAKLPGGRTLILVSDGFPLQPAREFYAVAGAFVPADPRFKAPGQTNLQPALEAVLRSAAAGNVRIDAIDSRGLAPASFAPAGSMDASTPSDRSAPSVIGRGPSSNRGGTLYSEMDRQAAAVSFQSGSAMEQSARATGGLYLHGSNDLLKQFRSALADGREYYLLAYTPSKTADDGVYRQITVEVAGKNLQVRAKAGYWAEKQ